jgi:glycyl-tRNA synthetase beta subunit
MIERKGPALSAPAQAVEGFAKSCGVDINALDKRELKGTDYYFFTQECLLTGKTHSTSAIATVKTHNICLDYVATQHHHQPMHRTHKIKV